MQLFTSNSFCNITSIWIYHAHLSSLFFGLSFYFPLYNDIPFRKRERDGDFSTRHSRRIPFSQLWFNSCGETIIPTTRGFASRGRNQFSITPATPCVGNWDVPFVTCGEIIFPTTRGFATRGRKYPVPYPLPQGNGTFLKFLFSHCFTFVVLPFRTKHFSNLKRREK